MQLRAFLVDRCGIGGKQRRQIGRGNLGIRIEFFDNGWQLIRFRTHQATHQPFDAGRFLLVWQLGCEPRLRWKSMRRDQPARAQIGDCATGSPWTSSPAAVRSTFSDLSACGCRAIPRASADGGFLVWRSTGLSVPPVSAPPGPGEFPSACGSASPAGSEPDSRE